MRILVTGCKGQLGQELMDVFSKESNYELRGYDSKTLNITDIKSISNVFDQFKPEVVINCAAYTKVDACETDYVNANAVNHIGPMLLARASELTGSKLIHISTDFVFNGKKESPYFEYDATDPLSIYGKTKLAGEWAVRNECKRHFIIRTSWLYGKYGNNFVKTMIRLGSQNKPLRVVNDQVGSPTNAADLINVLNSVMSTEKYGTYHFSNSGAISWYDFAVEIFRLNKMDVEVNPIGSTEFGSAAVRPGYSALDTGLIESSFNIKIENWKNSLESFVQSNSQILRGM